MSNDNFDSSKYVKVNDRLSAFREEYPNGYIATFREGEQGGVNFKAVVLRNADDAEVYAKTNIAAATGHAYLADEDRYDQKVEEYCETVAIGRALAILGYAVEKSIASQEEIDEFKKKYNIDDAKEKEVEEEPEEEEEQEEEVRPAASKKKRRTRKTSKSEDSEKDSEDKPKLRSARRFNRGSKLKK
jgi:hypothetical protein